MQVLGPVVRSTPEEWARLSQRDQMIANVTQLVGRIRWLEANGGNQREIALLTQQAMTLAGRIQDGLYPDHRGWVSLREVLYDVMDKIALGAYLNRPAS